MERQNNASGRNNGDNTTQVLALNHHVMTRLRGCHGYSPEHLCELSFDQRYNDGEADAGRDQVEQSGLQREGMLV